MAVIEAVSLALLSLALLISICLNVFFCIRQRSTLCKETDECCFRNMNTGASPSQDEGHYFHEHNHEELQENPIYGNISSDRADSVEVCYEMMTMEHATDCMKSIAPDLNYASLDLKLVKKRMKKNRHQQGPAQRRSKLQEELPGHLTPPLNTFLEVEADMDAHLPSRNTSTMVSHSSIYLNSQQIAQETEELERDRGVNMEREIVGWGGIRKGQSREWKGEQEFEGRKDRHDANGVVCTQLSEVEAIQNSSFSHDSEHQD
ncbi:uncharacterized protein LOC117490502 [Trematomus bernacchii]|uniref:uncharacterized protein LOC117490502 n=1 Tax=Trematomus bernacchii TaxID=40690 RepID=UPI00146F7A3C|nr:uncharacterized protein LOC117490502 [Trematomus bernacchii]